MVSPPSLAAHPLPFPPASPHPSPPRRPATPPCPSLCPSSPATPQPSLRPAAPPPPHLQCRQHRLQVRRAKQCVAAGSAGGLVPRLLLPQEVKRSPLLLLLLLRCVLALLRLAGGWEEHGGGWRRAALGEQRAGGQKLGAHDGPQAQGQQQRLRQGLRDGVGRHMPKGTSVGDMAGQSFKGMARSAAGGASTALRPSQLQHPPLPRRLPRHDCSPQPPLITT